MCFGRHGAIPDRRADVSATRCLFSRPGRYGRSSEDAVRSFVAIREVKTMEYRTIGKTGVRISEIGFGCGNNAVLMVKAPYEDQVKAVRHALDCGINFFDTA